MQNKARICIRQYVHRTPFELEIKTYLKLNKNNILKQRNLFVYRKCLQKPWQATYLKLALISTSSFLPVRKYANLNLRPKLITWQVHRCFAVLDWFQLLTKPSLIEDNNIQQSKTHKYLQCTCIAFVVEEEKTHKHHSHVSIKITHNLTPISYWDFEKCSMSKTVSSGLLHCSLFFLLLL